MNKRLLALLFASAVALLSGCVTQLESNVAPGTDLESVRKLHVVHLPQDERGVDRLIADRLNLIGKEATYGEKSAMPEDVDAIVTYQDKWMWDITCT